MQMTSYRTDKQAKKHLDDDFVVKNDQNQLASQEIYPLKLNIPYHKTHWDLLIKWQQPPSFDHTPSYAVLHPI